MSVSVRHQDFLVVLRQGDRGQCLRFPVEILDLCGVAGSDIQQDVVRAVGMDTCREDPYGFVGVDWLIHLSGLGVDDTEQAWPPFKSDDVTCVLTDTERNDRIRIELFNLSQATLAQNDGSPFSVAFVGGKQIVISEFFNLIYL